MAEVIVIVGKKNLANYMGYLFIKSANQELKDKVIILARHPNIDKATVLADWVSKTFGFNITQTDIIPSNPNPRTPVTVKITLRRT